MVLLENQIGIQSLVFSGHSRLTHSVSIWFTAVNMQRAKSELRNIVKQHVTFDVPSPDRREAVQLAISGEGVRSLSNSPDSVVGLSREFLQGVTAPHRKYILGDHGKNDPGNWSWSDRDCHVVILIYANDEPHLESLTREICGGLSTGWNEAARLAIRLDQHEPFGFRDGISNPRIQWHDDQQSPSDSNDLPPGELILGFPDSTGAVSETTKLGKFGSYLVIRQLKQDVKGFWEFWRSQSKNDTEAVWLASKAIGRWPNGMPISGSLPTQQPEYNERIVNTPLSFRDDLYGDACPLGAHIRRANPRDGLSHDTEQSLTISSLHRIVRRGRVYGPAVPDDWLPENISRAERTYHSEREEADPGILFLGLCSNLARQFEFVQQTWLNNPKHIFPVGEVDPVVAGISHEPTSNKFTIPRLPLKCRIDNPGHFVTVRGAGYFLLPCRAALDWILTDG